MASIGIDRNNNCTSCGTEVRDMTDDESLEYFFGQDYNFLPEEKEEALREIDNNCTLFVCLGCAGTYYLD